MSSLLVPRASSASYASNGYDAVLALQAWYNQSTGLWETAGWWNSANCLTVLGDFALGNSSASNALSIPSIMTNTFTHAQGNRAVAQKSIATNGLVTSVYAVPTLAKRDGFAGFLNDYYDDEGWWALALIRAWDVTSDSSFLDMAENIFGNMMNGTDDTCGGGIWWSKSNTYKNAIANELYLSVAASLANRVSNSSVPYRDIAQKQWAWFQNSGLINSGHLINDGLAILANGTCINNGVTTWSYNQGVVLGGLVELARATNNTSLLAGPATEIALAAVAALSDANGTIHEAGGCEPNCGADGAQFKGIFLRNLHYLYRAHPAGLDAVRTAILHNADSIWAYDRDGPGRIGIDWAGPPSAGGGPNASTHSSGMDTIVGAMAVA